MGLEQFIDNTSATTIKIKAKQRKKNERIMNRAGASSPVN